MAHLSDTRSSSPPPPDILAWHAEFNLTLADLSRTLTSGLGIEEVAQLVLDRAQRLTASSMGFVGYVDQDSGLFVCPALTREAWESCRVKNKELTLNSFQGLHGNLIGNGQPILCNDPGSILQKTNLPAGHTGLKRFLSAPCLLRDGLVGQLALANPKQAYTERDMAAVQALADLFALAIQQHRLFKNTHAGMSGWSHNLAPKTPAPSKKPSLAHSGKIGVGVAHTDERGRYVWVSEGLCQLLGYSSGELLTKTLSDLVPVSERETQSGLRAKIDSSQASECSMEARLLRKNGSDLRCRITIARLDDSPNTGPTVIEAFEPIVGHAGLSRETGLATIEKAAILDAINDSVVLQDFEYQIIWANQASTQFSGLPPSEILGRRCYEVWHQSDQVCPECQILSCLHTGQSIEQQVKTPGGQTIMIRMHPLRDSQGKVVAAVKLARDITNEAEAQSNLEENEKLLRTVLEVSSDGWWNYLAHSDDMYLSSNVWKLLGREINGQGLKHKGRASMIHPDDREESISAFKDHLAGRTPRLEVELRLHTAQGDWRWFLARGQVTERSDGGRAVSAVGILMDINERKQA